MYNFQERKSCLALDRSYLLKRHWGGTLTKYDKECPNNFLMLVFKEIVMGSDVPCLALERPRGCTGTSKKGSDSLFGLYLRPFLMMRVWTIDLIPSVDGISRGVDVVDLVSSFKFKFGS